MKRPILLVLLLALPVLALSSRPGEEARPRDGWKLDRKVVLPVRGSSTGQAGLGFLSKGQQRKIILVVDNAEPGFYEFEASRSDGRRQVLGQFQHPREKTKTLTPSHPQFANIYSGYWEYYQAVKVQQRAEPPPPVQPPVQPSQPPSDPSAVRAKPPTDIFDPSSEF